MGVYDEDIATAEEMIREAGKPVQIVRTVPGAPPDPTKPWIPGEPVETLDDAYAVFLNFNQQDMETLSKMEGASEIQASDRKVLLAAAALTGKPTINDKLRDTTGDWAIEWVQELSPNGENILYTMRVRQ